MTTPTRIQGMACRVPGAASLPEFWELLQRGEAATDHPGRGPLRHDGGYLEDVAGFDAAAFGMNEREAAAADPQQRLLLETAWQAIADSGLSPAVLGQDRVGVFIGCCADDYALLTMQAGLGGSPYTLTGISRTMLANRVSHHFGFTGPSLTVDTGQSSSLTALHLARASLDSGECDVAVVAGVHLNLHPFREEAMDALGLLSPDGVCRPLDEGADGTVRGEGCVVVVLSRRDSALPAYAELVATAIGHDGGAGGLTEPNPAAQVRLFRDVLGVAGLRPEDLQYAELHGTGTPVGDRVEAGGLAEALGPTAGEEPLDVGSVKATIGHLEGAAGLAGLVKTALMLRAQRVVPTPGHRTGAPSGVSVVTDAQNRSLDHATVSSFGIGGSNVCALLSRAASDPATSAAPGPAGHLALVVGGTDEAGARRRAEQLAGHLASTGTVRPAGLRSTEMHLPLRYGLPVGPEDDAQEALLAFARGDRPATGVRGVGEPLVMCFPGQGTQRHRMAMDLYDHDAAFAGDLDRVDDVVAPLLGESVRRLLTDGDVDLARYDVCQAVIFAVEVALADHIARWGVRPDVVLGHSLGEISAAHVAGYLDLPDAALLVVERGRLMQTVAADGAMASVLGDLSAIDVDALGEDIDVAARNSPTSMTISGPRAALGAACERLDRVPGVRTKPLASGGASHSRLMDPIAGDLDAVARSLTWRPAPAGAPRLVSAMTGEVIEPTAAHWQEHLRRPVHYARAVDRAYGLGGRVFLEVGPGRTLTTLNRQVLQGKDHLALPTVGGSGVATTTAAYADLAAAGHGHRDRPAARPPALTFTREPYWLDDRRETDPGAPEVSEATTRTPSDGEVSRPDGAEIADAIRSSLTRLVHAPTESLDDPFTSFADLGLDSLAAMSLAEELSTVLDRPVSASALYDFPSPASLTGALQTGEDL